MGPQECELAGGYGATVLVGYCPNAFIPTESGRVYGERSRIACEHCSARGWLPPPDEDPVKSRRTAGWPVPCEVCDGKTNFSLHAIAETIEEDAGALYRLTEQRIRPKTALRLLDKLLLLIANKTPIPAGAGILQNGGSPWQK